MVGEVANKRGLWRLRDTDGDDQFDKVEFLREMKGGGDAVSAARAVLQTGEYDFAWNMQVEDEILLRLEKDGKGRVVITEGGGIEHIQLNFTDPWTEVDGERASLKTKHPTLQYPEVRQALALLVDKDQKPKWNPATVEGVTRDMVEAHFEPVANDLFFD